MRFDEVNEAGGIKRIGNMNALRRRAPLAWVPSPCLGPVPVT
jgi:hypothetical protein